MFRLSIKLRSTANEFWASRNGATAIEYGLIVGGISVAVMAVVFEIGGSLENLFNEILTALCGDTSNPSDTGLEQGQGHGCK